MIDAACARALRLPSHTARSTPPSWTAAVEPRHSGDSPSEAHAIEAVDALRCAATSLVPTSSKASEAADRPSGADGRVFAGEVAPSLKPPYGAVRRWCGLAGIDGTGDGATASTSIMSEEERRLESVFGVIGGVKGADRSGSALTRELGGAPVGDPLTGVQRDAIVGIAPCAMPLGVGAQWGAPCGPSSFFATSALRSMPALPAPLARVAASSADRMAGGTTPVGPASATPAPPTTPPPAMPPATPCVPPSTCSVAEQV